MPILSLTLSEHHHYVVVVVVAVQMTRGAEVRGNEKPFKHNNDDHKQI